MSNTTATPSITFRHLWSQNAALVQLLGLCPLLAISNTVVNALILGCATLCVTVLSELLISLTRHWIPAQTRLPIFVLVIGGLVGMIDLLMETWFFEAHKVLGLFVPLIVTNCIILARVEAFASKNPPHLALMDALITGSGFLLSLLLLGIVREAIGYGTLFRNADTLLGLALPPLQLTPSSYGGFIPALLPVGTFFACALLIVLSNVIKKNE